MSPMYVPDSPPRRGRAESFAPLGTEYQKAQVPLGWLMYVATLPLESVKELGTPG